MAVCRPYDNLKASKSFSQGQRDRPGGAIASAVLRLFLAMVLWQFDFEAMPGQESRSVDEEFRLMTFRKNLSFWARFRPNQRLPMQREDS